MVYHYLYITYSLCCQLSASSLNCISGVFSFDPCHYQSVSFSTYRHMFRDNMLRQETWSDILVLNIAHCIVYWL
jgi:hypothetical protein